MHAKVENFQDYKKTHNPYVKLWYDVCVFIISDICCAWDDAFQAAHCIIIMPSTGENNPLLKVFHIACVVLVRSSAGLRKKNSGHE